MVNELQLICLIAIIALTSVTFSTMVMLINVCMATLGWRELTFQECYDKWVSGSLWFFTIICAILSGFEIAKYF